MIISLLLLSKRQVISLLLLAVFDTGRMLGVYKTKRTFRVITISKNKRRCKEDATVVLQDNSLLYVDKNRRLIMLPVNDLGHFSMDFVSMNLKLLVLAATTTLQSFYSEAKNVETSLPKYCSNNDDCQLHEICLDGYCAAQDEDQNLTVPLIICSVAVFLIIIISARMCKLMFCHGEGNGFVEGMDGNTNVEPTKGVSFAQQTKIKFTRSKGEQNPEGETLLNPREEADTDHYQHSYGSIRDSHGTGSR